MKSRTLASEKTRNFYCRLKRPYLFNGYLIHLGLKNMVWHKLSSQQKQNEFQINQIAFFKKHFWYHFNKVSISGWVPAKHFRKNYCRLKVTAGGCPSNINSELACIIMLCHYIKPNVDVTQLINEYQRRRPKSVKDLFMIVAGQLGRFQNVSHKSMRRLRSQIRHQCPVVVKIWRGKRPAEIILTGFNRRRFYYVSPYDDQLHLITRKRLLKTWRQCHYQAFSY